MPEDSVTLPSVVKRFKEAAAALESMEDTISKLRDSQERKDAAAEAIEHSTQVLDGFIEGTSELSSDTRSAITVLQDTLEQARKFLDKTDPAQVQNQLQQLQATTSKITELLEKSVRDAELKADEASTAREVAETELAELKAKVNSIPERKRQKLGL